MRPRMGTDREVLGLIPAAGRAERLGRLPCSKELLPIGFRETPQGPVPKVACHYLLERFRAAGIRRAYLVLHESKWDVARYFGTGAMVDMALAYLSIPSLLFGISKGGDYIDNSVGSVVNEPSTRIKMIKEEKLDLTKAPADKLEKALHIYYEDLVESLVDSIRKAVAKADKLPRSHRPLPIVIAGGTAKPRGFKELFERSVKSRPFPVDVSEIRVASDPVTATARGALIAALYEK